MGLDVILIRDPNKSGELEEELGEKYMDISFSYTEWESFFYDELGAERIIYVPGQFPPNWLELNDELFRSRLSKYPLLARSIDYYSDAFWAPNEVEQLLQECLPLKERIRNSEAREFLLGMIRACRDAIKNGTGIFLAAD